MFGKKQFQLMKNSAFLINTARGQLIIESDLYQALINHEIAGAALDVFENEPPNNDKLINFSNLKCVWCVNETFCKRPSAFFSCCAKI